MRSLRKYLGLVAAALSFPACEGTHTVEGILDAHKKAAGSTDHIRYLETAANCTGPDGTYFTRTETSFTDDYLLFRQDYTYKNSPFYAAIYTKKEGYGLDTLLNAKGPLSDAVIAVLKAHEFHELMLQVDRRYSGMQVANDTIFFQEPCRQILAADHLGYPVRLYFNKKSKLMAGMSQVNPYRKSEVISVHFEEWADYGNLKLFDQVTVMQGPEKEYFFDYTDVNLNPEDFQKLEVKTE